MNRPKFLAIVIYSPAVALFGAVFTLMFRLQGAELAGQPEGTIFTPQVGFLTQMQFSMLLLERLF